MKTYLIIGVIVALFLNMGTLMALNQHDVFDIGLFDSILSEKITFDIPDECGVILGNVIHNVGSQEICENKCHTSCQSQDKKFFSATFQAIPEDQGCHLCECTCS